MNTIESIQKIAGSEQSNEPGPNAKAAIDRVCRVIAGKDFCFLSSDKTRELLRSVSEKPLEDWPEFQKSWSDLYTDGHMADGGKYRKRRHATLSALPSSRCFQRQPHQPHYQSLTYNDLNGGIPRHYQPIDDAILNGATMQALITLGCELFGRLAPYSPWHIEMHQFRIEANSSERDQPTPEGVHRDGVNFVMMVMVQRTNLVNVATTIFGTDKTRLDEFTLQQPLDMAIVNDERVFHGVTPIVQLDADKPALRDVLVITFRRKN